MTTWRDAKQRQGTYDMPTLESELREVDEEQKAIRNGPMAEEARLEHKKNVRSGNRLKRKFEKDDNDEGASVE